MDQVAEDRSLERKAYWICLIGGGMLWLLTALLSGRSEAWDSPYYWSLAYPMSILLAGIVANLAGLWMAVFALRMLAGVAQPLPLS
ncbi:hypothetical protein [Thioalkalivibrio sulfidiphilus]|uniref:hypothetical protein n=1 Tax=Thioalkalivibrio sulfidiphilus TaxID=1033854 RepID=UPI0018CB9F48|nr:hypothetical protein [Thioalkalivibrio sulfidiphilus]